MFLDLYIVHVDYDALSIELQYLQRDPYPFSERSFETQNSLHLCKRYFDILHFKCNELIIMNLLSNELIM